MSDQPLLPPQRTAEVELPEQIRALRAAVDGLRDLAPGVMSGAQLAASLAEIETLQRRITAESARLLGDFDARECAREFAGSRGTTSWLQERLLITYGESATRTRLARRLFGQAPVALGGARRSLLPETTSDWLAGRLSQAHVRIVDRVVTDLGREIDRCVEDEADAADRRACAEGLVLGLARECDPDVLKSSLSHLRAQLVPEAVADAEDQLWAMRRLSRFRLMDGMQSVDGMLTPEAARLADIVIGYFGRAGVVGEEDSRSMGQREHDGFVHAMRALVESGYVPAPQLEGGSGIADLDTDVDTDVDAYADTDAQADAGQLELAQIPVAAGSIAHLSVITDLETLQGLGGGSSQLFGGGAAGNQMLALDGATVGKLACDSDISLILQEGTTLLGESKSRVATGALKRMVMIRDRGCCRFPGCRAAIRHIHHLKPWAEGGPTKRSNLAGLCWFHHDLVHHEGWQLLGDPEEGDLRAVRPGEPASYLDVWTPRHRSARQRYLRARARVQPTAPANR